MCVTGKNTADSSATPPPRSRIADLVTTAEDTGLEERRDTSGEGAPAPPPTATQKTSPASPAPGRTDDPGSAVGAGRSFAAVLGEFRRTPVLVPVVRPDGGGDAGVLMAERGGVLWIYAFSHEEALSRFATARGEADREWEYQRLPGARLLDVVVPSVAGPCGVALDAADGAGGALFPPVRGVVPEHAAVDADAFGGQEPPAGAPEGDR
ncbi:SseB family protein [Streptomyces sp. NPDC050560]|uniref:SseB family protein n=1 Tax=Streptomyces sp. NPDC050560 TaxID=3365630 RepID=UPI0037896208